MPLPAAQTAGVDDHGDHQEDQVHPRYRLVIVLHPGIDEGGDGQKQEAQQRYQKAMVGPLQVGRSEEQQRQDDTRESQNEQQQEARHLASIVAKFTAVAEICGYCGVRHRTRRIKSSDECRAAYNPGSG